MHPALYIKTVLGIIALLGLTLCFGLPAAEAHRVSVFAWVEGDTVHVESKFSGGRRPRNAPVTVYDEAGNKLLEARTGAAGTLAFKVPCRCALKIVLEAGAGHRAEWTIPQSEIVDQDRPTLSADAADAPVQSSEAPTTEVSPAPAADHPGPAAGELKQIIDSALDRKLQPIMRQLAQLRRQDQGPSLTEILGGLGYIIGLVGLAAYLSGRRRTGKEG